MKVAIMQPYFFPYIGYFQLIQSVDLLIVYDNIKYTKKGWINRNRILHNSRETLFSLPLKKDSDFLDVCARELAADFKRDKLLNQITESYRRAPYYTQTFPLLEQIVNYSDSNLFNYLYHSITKTCNHLDIKTEIRVSSTVHIDHTLKNQEKVLALCAAANADTYINAIGGLDLYSKDIFQANNIKLAFIRAKPFEYHQFNNEFIPWLSIIDILMFNPLEKIRDVLLSNYELL